MHNARLSGFHQKLADHGHAYDGILIINSSKKFLRFRCSFGGKKNKSGAYFIRSGKNEDRLFGYFKCHHCGDDSEFRWVEDSDNFPKLSADELRTKIKEIQDDQRIQAGDRIAEQEKVAERAKLEWSKAIPISKQISTPYLANKKLDSIYFTDEQITSWGLARWGDNVYVPLKDIESNLWNIEQIYSNGDKRPLSGGRVDALFHLLGSNIDPDGTIQLVEGIATGIICYLANGVTTLCCRNADNLLKVARAIKNRYPNIKLRVNADDDKFKLEQNKRKIEALRAQNKKINIKLENAGIKSAHQVHKEFKAEITSPNFSVIGTDEYFLNIEKPPSDYHDIYSCLINQGRTKDDALNEVRRQLEITQQNLSHGNNTMENSAQKENSQINENKTFINDAENDGQETPKYETEQEQNERDAVVRLSKIEEDIKRERELQKTAKEISISVATLRNAVKKERKRIGEEQRKINRSYPVTSSVLDKFNMTEDGLIHTGKSTDGAPIVTQVTKKKIEIEGRISDYYSRGGFGLVLKLYDENGTEKRWSMPSRLMSDPKALEAELNDLGIYVYDIKKLITYLKAFESERAFIGVSQMGWHIINKEIYFVIGNEIISDEKSKESIVYQSQSQTSVFNVIEESLESWQHNIGRLCIGNNLLIGAISHALGSIVIGLTNKQNFGINIFGDSGIGKTTTGGIVRSVFGMKNQEASSTLVGMERTAYQNNDMVSIFEEMQRLPYQIMAEIVSLLGNGIGKIRGTTEINIRPTLTFRGHYFFTANTTVQQHIQLSGHLETEGHMVRLLDIPAAFGKHGVFECLHDCKSGGELSDRLQKETTKNHGALGREFIKRLILPENQIFITDSYEEIRTIMIANLSTDNNGQVRRTIDNFAKNAAAFEVAINLGLLGDHFKQGDGIAANVAMLNAWINNRGGTGNHESRKIINEAQGFISKHGSSRFQLEGTGSNGKPEERSSIPNRLGFKEWYTDSWVYYLSNEGFKELCGERNPNQVKKVLADAKIIETKEIRPRDGKPYLDYTQSHRFGGEKKTRYVVFTGGTDLENESES